MKALLVANIFFSLLWVSLAMNVSPVPNIILKIPDSGKNLNRPSHFGFSLNLRKSHIMIGAPRASSSVLSETSEPGEVYKCDFESTCEAFDMGQNRILRNSEKAYQSFGASMDGYEEDIFVACAPRFALIDEKDPENYSRMIGLCYYAKDTIKNVEAQFSNTLAPLNDSKKFYVDRKEISYSKNTYNEKVSEKDEFPFYIMGESGFSAHITEKKTEILIGAPGVLNSGGMVNKFIFYPSGAKKMVVVNMDAWDPKDSFLLDEETYFGYALTSGNFLFNKTIFVASAPKRNNIHDKPANANNGTVIFFEIRPKYVKVAKKTETKIYYKIHHLLNGTQMGSYFGYALLSDDFNKDGKADLVVSAPFYAKPNSQNNGIVYIYLNERKKKNTINLKNPENYIKLKLESPTSFGNERFGMALGKIGDINGDGFNDLAISGNLNDKGILYIYQGSKDGMTLSQKIEMSEISSLVSISRGVDIDENGFKDIAVGAPESDTVYIFKSYPVINLDINLKPLKSQVEFKDIFGISACIKISQKFQPKFPVEIFIEFIIVDSRVSFQNPADKNSTILIPPKSSSCKNLNLTVNVKFDVTTMIQESKPIKIEMTYNAVKNIPNADETFCEDCVLLASNKRAELKIPLNTGCSDGLCKPDLKVVGYLNDTSKKYVIGSVRNISVIFNISNRGDPAYFAKIEVSIPRSLKFLTVPKLCKKIESDETQVERNEPKLICDLKAEKPLKSDQTEKFNITLDVSENRELSVDITAKVYSGGEKVNDKDNSNVVTIKFEENSSVEIGSHVSEKYIDVKEGDLENHQMNYSFEILNRGPSDIRSITFELLLPLIFITQKNEKLQLLEIESVERIYSNEKVLIENEAFRPAEIGIDFGNSTVDRNNKTVYVNCSQSSVECKEVRIKVEDFESSSENSIVIILNLSIIKGNINKILNNTKDLMLITPNIQLKPSHPVNVTLTEIKEIFIKKGFEQIIFWWIYVASILGGLFGLFLMIFVLAKLGFFKRKIKQELVRIKRESMMFPNAARDPLMP